MSKVFDKDVALGSLDVFGVGPWALSVSPTSDIRTDGWCNHGYDSLWKTLCCEHKDATSSICADIHNGNPNVAKAQWQSACKSRICK